MAVIVDIEKCTGCSLCLKKCPYGAVEIVDKIAVIGERVRVVRGLYRFMPGGCHCERQSRRESRSIRPITRTSGVLAEQKDCRLNRTTFELLGCARGLAEGRDYNVTALLLGKGVESLAGESVCPWSGQSLPGPNTMNWPNIEPCPMPVFWRI